jgi:ankyrin repeat protein
MKAASLLSGLSLLAFPDFFELVRREDGYLAKRASSLTGIIRVGGSVEDFDERGFNPLHCAVEGHGQWHLISSLINDYRAQVNAQTKFEGLTALMLAVKYGNLELVRNLLQVPQIDVNAVSNDGRSALHFACEKGAVEAVDLLLSQGASPDLCMRGTEMKPIHFAIQHRHVEVLKMFQKRRVPLNGLYWRAVSGTFESCLHLLARTSAQSALTSAAKIEMAALLLPDFNEAEKGIATESVLKIATETDNEAIVAILLLFGADWTEPGLAENSLISAFKKKFSDDRSSIEAYLLPELWNLAIELNNLNLVLSLQALKVPTEQVDEASLINAMTGASSDYFTCVLVRSLSGRSEINARALMYPAVAVRLPLTLCAIIEVFKPQDFSLNNGHSLLHLAAIAPSSSADAESCAEIAKILLAAAPYLIHQTDITGSTPLHTAASTGSIGFVQALLGITFVIDQLDGEGNSALFLAFKAGHLELCLTLIQMGAREDLAVNAHDQNDRFSFEAFDVLFRELPDEEGDQNAQSTHLMLAEFGEDHEEIVFQSGSTTFELEGKEKPRGPTVYQTAVSFLLETSRTYVSPYVPYLQPYLNPEQREPSESSEDIVIEFNVSEK